METETLSSYDRAQDKHVLDASSNINISRSDEETDSTQTKEINLVNSEIGLQEGIHDNTDSFEIKNDSIKNKINKDYVQPIINNQGDHIENGSDSNTGAETEDEKADDEKETIESEETNKCFAEKSNDCGSNNSVVSDPLSDNERDLLNNDEKDPLDDEEKSPSNGKAKNLSSDEEMSPLSNEESSTLNNDETELLNNEREPLSNEREPLSNERESLSNETEPLSNETEPLSNEKSPLSHEEKQSSDAEEHETEKVSIPDVDNAEKDPHNNEEIKKDEVTDKELEQKCQEESKEGKNDRDSVGEVKEIEGELSVEENEKENKELAGEKDVTDKKNSSDAVVDKAEVNSGETEGKSESPSEESQKGKSEDIVQDCPLLKETLTKVRNEDNEQQKEAEGENAMEDIEMDDDFDPSLLCPDIAMEVDEAPVITNNENTQKDGNKSPLLYEPVFSTYVDEMTGAEVSFNLSPEEQQLRQQTYGDANPVQYTRTHCTACNVHLGSALDAQSNRFVHPLLKVLICKDCYHFYTSGEFEKDEDGSELYCRWCGQGGQVICCSSCEMVFCKKCIRINFGRKKLTEIRDSEEWLCFRCNITQLAPLRIHCAEFMEYVRREISRAATLENATSFTTTDYTQCCLAQKKKYVEPHSSEPKKKKRKTSINDPDYDPIRDQPSPPPSPAVVPKVETVTPQKPVPILPKPMDPNHNAGIVTQVTQNNQVFKVGNTIFRPRASQFSQPRPRVQVINPVTTVPGVVRPTSSGPGYIKIMPGGIRVPPSPTRNQPAQTYVSPSSRSQASFQQRGPRPLGNANSQMKHEWFEKTVRAAARVNSNLSYTLTQLNRAQATATSVEALAVVHNKLQEILSTSINSLIQIRKNLRTEFIAGIKNIRFPPKPAQPQPSTSAQDDDVIFISPTPSPVPPPIVPSSSITPITAINLPPSVSLTKRMPTPSPSTSSDPVPSTSKDTSNDKPKVFLRVKSLTALQNVPSECITIPDDPLPPPPPLTPIRKVQDDVTIIENNPEKNDVNIVIKDVTTVVEQDPLAINTEKDNTEADADITNGGKEQNEQHSNDEEEKKNEFQDIMLSFNIKDTPPHELKRMLNVRVHITRSEKMEELMKHSFGLTNGDTSE